METDGKRGLRDAGTGRGRMVLMAALVLGLATTRPAGADEGKPNPKVAVGFSNLVARLDNADEIGFAKPEYRVHILETLRGAGFNAVGAENLVFNRDDSDKADMVLGGTVKEVECRDLPQALRCSVGIEWQLLDRQRDDVVYRVLTRYAALDLPRNNDAALGKLLTLGALKSLMQRPHFKELLNAEAAPVPTEADYPAATFTTCNAAARELPKDFDAVAESTVIIKSGGGVGSGFYLTDGLIMTAAHVVSASKVEIRTRAGKTLAGQVVRISTKHDVALVAVPPAGASPSCLVLEPTPQTPGNEVYAIGSPGGEELGFSLSRGIVSGLRTQGDVALVQTDASLNPGNSGGALLDNQGRVIGVVSRKIAGHAVEGLGFAVPVQAALSALRLEPAASTTPSLLELGAPRPEAARPKNVLTDTPDAKPSLDPEGDRERAEAADYQRRLKEQRDRTPAYVTPLRWGGVVVGSVGLIGALVTASDRKPQMTRSEYEDVRLKNDLSWIAVALGSGAFISSFVLTPKLAPAKTEQAGNWRLLAGPGNVQAQVSFQ